MRNDTRVLFNAYLQQLAQLHGVSDVTTKFTAAPSVAQTLETRISRNKLARSVGQALRRSQQQRIIAQRNPDGGKYAPRKQRNLRGKQGRVKWKVKMFQKLRTASFLKVHGDGNAISVGFSGRVARIARVHQHGLKDHAESGAPNVEYERRELLGFIEANLALIKNALLSQLTI